MAKVFKPMKSITCVIPKNPDLSFNWAGNISFKQSLVQQEELKTLAKNKQFCFFGFQCLSPVISLGLRSKTDHILWEQQKLKQHDILVEKVKRGGEATLHAPGQLVIYPVVHLPSLAFKVKDFILALQQITQTFLKSLNIKTHKQGAMAGLYTPRGKICFFGIHISQGISQHGLALNVDNDLNLFKAIKSCGQRDRLHDKLSFYPQVNLNLKALFITWCKTACEFLKHRAKKP